jgi:hypothetical protein
VLLVLVRNASVLGPIGIDPAIADETRKFLQRSPGARRR